MEHQTACEAACRTSAICSHFSWGAGNCSLCQGCSLTDSHQHESWRRMGAIAAFTVQGKEVMFRQAAATLVAWMLSSC